MRKKIIITSIIVVVVIIIIAVARGGDKGPEYVTAQATIGTVVQTVDATGSVSSAEDIELNFKSTGKVQTINIKVGDTVSIGQRLATLDTSALNSKVADARSALLEAQANLEQVLAGSTPEDIRISEITVEQKEQALLSAQNDLENLKLQQAIELKNLKNTAIVTLDNELVDAIIALDTINLTLNNNDAQATLGALDSSAVPIAEDSQIEAIASVDTAQASTADISELSTNIQVLEAINIIMQALDDVQVCLADVYNVLEKTIISSELTQTELDALKSGITTKQTTISTARTALQAAETNWTNKQAYYNDQITKAEDNVAEAQDTLDLAQAQLALKKADPENYEITAYKAKVAKAEANLAYALANLNDVIVFAPVNGTITQVNRQIGEQTSLATPIIQMIGQSALEIEVDIPESDIAKIEVGQPTQITLDSFGDEQIFSGTITFIDPAETVIQDVVYYQVKVQFDDGKDNVKPGMTANVTIQTQMKENVLNVPLRAVKQRNGNKVVEILVAEQVEEKQVTTGLRGDEFMEIVTGLEEGQSVITFIKNGK